MDALLSGFALGLSLILAIGAQNAFVLRQGLRREHVLAVCLCCALSDAVLIAAGVAGFGVIVEMAPWSVEALRWGGAGFLALYGGLSLWRALGPPSAMRAAQAGAGSLRGAVLTCLALTWLNPHVWLDTVLLGSISAGHAPAWAFALGAMAASFAFFFALGFGARALAPLFARPSAWRILDAVVCATMWTLAAALAAG